MEKFRYVENQVTNLFITSEQKLKWVALAFKVSVFKKTHIRKPLDV